MNGNVGLSAVLAGLGGLLATTLTLAQEPKIAPQLPDTGIRPKPDLTLRPLTQIPKIAPKLPDTGVKPAPERVFYPVGVRVDRGHTAPFSSVDTKRGFGEVQSTVVPPGAKAECPKGRLLISDDMAKNPGAIGGIDLDNLTVMASTAAIDPLPDTNQNQRILSNDHDLVLLNNGEVLYIRMGQAKTPLSPKPVWFDYAYKKRDTSPDFWGPGARSVIFVWRSEDCGETFSFRSAIDTAKMDDGWGSANDGSGGMPQLPAFEVPPGTQEQPVYQMGGTDGPLAKVDRATNRVFYTMKVAGNVPDTPIEPFLLTGQKINHSMVAMSDDRGDSWVGATSFFFPEWRTEVVPGANDQLAFAASATQGDITRAFIHYTKVGVFPGQGQQANVVPAPIEQGTWGWSQLPWEHSLLYKKSEDKEPTDTMKTNFAGQTVLTRSPSSQGLLMAFMDTLEQDAGDGYRLYFVKGNTWIPMPPIAPLVPDPDNFILHLTGIDLGIGPVLFYWYDIDSSARTATIRGRLVARDDLSTRDFKISESFSVATGSKWYGDYHTAGGFLLEKYLESKSHPRGPQYEYYPVWVQPDKKVHFAKVGYSLPVKRTNANDGHFSVAPSGAIRMQRQTLHSSRLTFPEPVEEEEQQTEPKRRSGLR